MKVTIQQESTIPIHRQLEEQIKQLIWDGNLKPQLRLPSVRELAGYLRVNRNTVAKAYESLEREGFVVGEGARGTRVADSPPAQPRTAEIHLFLAETLKKAATLGLTAESLSLKLLAYNQSSATEDWQRRRVLLLECNEPQLVQFKGELESSLPVSVETCLLENFSVNEISLQDYALVLTTFFHVDEVKEKLGNARVELVTLLLGDNLPTLMHLRQLPRGTRVALVCETEHGLTNFLRSLHDSGLDKLEVAGVVLDDFEGINRALSTASLVICSSRVVEEKIRDQLPQQVELITDDRSLDKQGIELLRQRFGLFD